MGPRAALILACLCAVGCGDTSATPDMQVGANDMAAVGGFDLGHIGCSIPITVTPNMAVPPVTLTAAADSSAAGASNVKWQVQRAGDPAMDLPAGPTPLNVSFVATQPGTYTFYVSGFLNGETCNGMGSSTVNNPSGVMVHYRLRALPPESKGLPLTDRLITLTGGQPLGGQIISLDSGTPIAGRLQGPGGMGIAGEVRLIASAGPDALATADNNGAFKLAVLSSGLYQPLLVPQSTTLAPHLGTSDTGINFANAAFSVGAGEPVTGSVVDNAAAAVANARVVLRAGALPSGVGITTAAGTFTLRAEQQTYGLSVGADEWPIASLSGVAVPAGGVNVAVAYTVPRVPVAATVVRSDGTTPVAGARVTVASRSLGVVANITVGNGGAQAAAGRVLRQVISDANGKLPPLQLPAGTYDLIVDPAPDTKPEGLTAITKVLAGADTWTLALQPRVTLSGKVSDGAGNGVGGTQVTAVELAGLGAAPTATTASDGTYSITVDAGAALMVVFAPPGNVKLAGTKISLAAGSTHADATLPPGLPVAGLVKDPSGAGLGSVIVEALCYSCGSDAPINTAVTDGSGAFQLYLPDPGDIAVDGGTP